MEREVIVAKRMPPDPSEPPPSAIGEVARDAAWALVAVVISVAMIVATVAAAIAFLA